MKKPSAKLVNSIERLIAAMGFCIFRRKEILGQKANQI
jgi:hypothetical protein